MYAPDISMICKLPKIDLHRHLDGDVKPEVISRLARKDGLTLPAEDLDLYFKDLRNQGIGALLQKGFGLVTSLMQSRENLSTVAYECVRNLKEDNIIYAEIRFAPQYHTGESAYYGHSSEKSKEKTLGYDEIIKAVSAGLRKGEKDFGVRTNLIVCVGREAEPQAGVAVAEAALNSMDCGVVGLDLACDEGSYPPDRHLEAYKTTFNSPLKRTVHAGEFGDQPSKNMSTAISNLKADRLGHAIPLSKYEDLTTAVSDGKIGIEMCPESNIFTGFIKSRNELGIKRLLSKGVLVSVNTDDPAMFGYTLSDTLYRLAEECGLGLDELKKLQLNAIESAFGLGADERAKLAKIIEDNYKIQSPPESG